MDGDIAGARKWFTESRKQAVSIRMREGMNEADTALKRLDRLDGLNPTPRR